MQDWRRDRGRRKSDTKWHQFLCLVIHIVVVFSLMYTTYLIGGNYAKKDCTAQVAKQVAEIEQKLFQNKMEFYGRGYYYFSSKGQNYFVKQAKDLENESKWIKVK